LHSESLPSFILEERKMPDEQTERLIAAIEKLTRAVENIPRSITTYPPDYRAPGGGGGAGYIAPSTSGAYF
jgi:hypothetical protein